MNDDYDNLLPALLAWLKKGKKVAVATLVSISGGSARPLGAQLLVNEDGESLGIISSGCVEADIKLAALEVITTGKIRHYNYGADSPYMDLTLPCGSSIKVVVNMAPRIALVSKLCTQLQRREKASIILDLSNGQWLSYSENHKNSDVFVCHYMPTKQLVVIGKGRILEHVVEIANASGLDVHSYSPDHLENDNRSTILQRPESFTPKTLDAATAVLVLFHDHDWEPLILKKIFEFNVSYIGVLGSVNSHRQRLEHLKLLKCSDEECKRIISPAGLIKGTRHPQHIALSMISEAMSYLYQSGSKI